MSPVRLVVSDLDGTLEELKLAAAVSPPGAAAPAPVWIGADTRVRPFADEPLGPVELRLNGVDPAQLGLDQLRARLSGSATLNWSAGRLRMRFSL